MLHYPCPNHYLWLRNATVYFKICHTYERSAKSDSCLKNKHNVALLTELQLETGLIFAYDAYPAHMTPFFL
jgi:hypothetical protein